MALTSALLLRISAEHYPPFKVTMFTKVYELTGHPQPPNDADEATLYEHALEFLDKFVEEARARGLEWPRNLLEAQSVVHMLRERVGVGQMSGRSLPDERSDPPPAQRGGLSFR